jgi:hypothetical protein
MTAPDRRAFMAATAASIATPTVLGAKECPNAGMDWITMSLDARNLAYNNVEHVGPENARKKTEAWAAASKMLREPCATSGHCTLNLREESIAHLSIWLLIEHTARRNVAPMLRIKSV